MPSEIRAQGSLIGTKLGGYQVEALIGRGAMGSVYLARDTKLNRHVALKVLLGSLARTPSIVKQFHQEAQSAAPLNHPNIVRIYSAGIERGTPYIAMEFVDGEPLDRFLKRKGKVNWDVALHVGAKVALALDCAHQHGIVHRDVKPSNILVDRKGGVRLTDFGIARMHSGDGRAGGPVVGTPQYMSPEQATGGEVGPVSDLFSLGVTLYQMISGEMPFKGESSMQLVRSICEDDPPRLNKLIPDVPDDVARLVAYLMEKKPVSRPASAKVAYGLIHRLQKHRGAESAVAESLTAFLKEEMEPRPFSSIERKEAQSRRKSSKVRRRLRRSRFRGGLVAQALLIVLLASGAFAFGPLAASRGRVKSPPPATAMALIKIEPVDTGIRRFGLLADGHRVETLTWLSDDGALIATTRGARGTLADGAAGILALDTVSGSILNLAAPYTATSGFENARVRPIDASFTFGHKLPPNSRFFNAIPVLARGDRADTAVLLAQPWRAATPRAEILFAAPLTTAQPLRAGDQISIAVHPSGKSLCVALIDPNTGLHYIVEHDVGAASDDDTRRTSPGADILPGSVQYTPDGGRIAYLRLNPLGEIELWMLRSGRNEVDGRRIRSGIAGRHLSFHPDGEYAAAVLASDGAAEVSMLNTLSGEIAAVYGAGSLCPQAWLADGSGFLYVSADEEPQLMFASSQVPQDVRRVTYIRGGVGPAYAVAGVSGEVAVADSASENPGVYVLGAGVLQRAIP